MNSCNRSLLKELEPSKQHPSAYVLQITPVATSQPPSCHDHDRNLITASVAMGPNIPGLYVPDLNGLPSSSVCTLALHTYIGQMQDEFEGISSGSRGL